jgi:hypothetical protein
MRREHNLDAPQTAQDVDCAMLPGTGAGDTSGSKCGRGEVCSDEGRAVRSSPLQRQAQRFGRGHNLPPVNFRCSAPQRDQKSPKPNSNPVNVGLAAVTISHQPKFVEPRFRAVSD